MKNPGAPREEPTTRWLACGTQGAAAGAARAAFCAFLRVAGAAPLWRKLLLRLIGLVLLLGGLLLLVLPGPGLLCLIAGLALLGADLPPLSAALDRGELQLRAWWRRR